MAQFDYLCIMAQFGYLYIMAQFGYLYSLLSSVCDGQMSMCMLYIKRDRLSLCVNIPRHSGPGTV